MSTEVDVGFVDEFDNWLLHPRFFPNKIGGKPAWLDLENLPSPSNLSCIICKDPLIFLCQVYAPIELNEYCCHRTIFVFICRNGSCCQTNSAKNLMILRCQLPLHNNFYSSEPYDEEKDEEFPMDKWSRLCYVCGMKGSSHCSKCKKIFYCSRKHQIIDWKAEHKACCTQMQESDEVDLKNFKITKSGQTLLFKEWLLDMDEEDKVDVCKTDAELEMRNLTQMIRENRHGSLSTVSERNLKPYCLAIDDKVYDRFSGRVARHPHQVLRYCKGGTPLWICKSIKNDVNDIPNCQYCNGERQFEFQIMPQLLNKFGDSFVLGIDWGILAVFTCKNSCNEGPAYKEEFVIKQDFL